MWIIGVDYHPSVQQIAFVNTDTGGCGERRLHHSEGEAEKFYRELKAVSCSVRVGMEASGYARWFERLLEDRFPRVWVPQCGKSRSASTAVASASAGADAHADHESVAGRGHE